MISNVKLHDLRSHFLPVGSTGDEKPGARVAAIAIVFWHSPDGVRVCLGRRAIDPRDPWSGDMAFPGGKAEPQDDSLHDVAARETFEEVGLVLPRDSLMGSMPQFDASGAGRKPTLVWPLIYAIDTTPKPFRLSSEMSEAHWVPLAELWDRRNWMAFSFPATRAQRPGIVVGNHFLWGFSLHVLIELSETLGCPLKEIMHLEKVTHVDCISAA